MLDVYSYLFADILQIKLVEDEVKTVKRKRLNPITMSVRNKPDVVIDNGVIKRYVGIGWVSERNAPAEDKNKYPTVID